MHLNRKCFHVHIGVKYGRKAFEYSDGCCFACRYRELRVRVIALICYENVRMCMKKSGFGLFTKKWKWPTT